VYSFRKNVVSAGLLWRVKLFRHIQSSRGSEPFGSFASSLD
jgi:hypothetical protein